MTKQPVILCKCGCGRYANPGNEFILGHYNRTHGMTRTKIYKCWKNIRQRCEYPNCKDYKNYGGRGITVCKKWSNSFLSFFNDMGDIPFKKASIDRINNEKGYFKNNCRWATNLQQAHNKRVPTPNQGVVI